MCIHFLLWPHLHMYVYIIHTSNGHVPNLTMCMYCDRPIHTTTYQLISLSFTGYSLLSPLILLLLWLWLPDIH